MSTSTTGEHKLPDRAGFLLSGWVPVNSSITCAICYDKVTHPVQLPCHHTHIFCKECIFSWLELPEANRCPTCRAKLFAPDEVFEDFSELMDHVRNLRRRRGDANGTHPDLDFLINQIEGEYDELDDLFRAHWTPQWSTEEDLRRRSVNIRAVTEDDVWLAEAWQTAEVEVSDRFRRFSDFDLSLDVEDGELYESSSI